MYPHSVPSHSTASILLPDQLFLTLEDKTAIKETYLGFYFLYAALVFLLY